jgi:FkbM family methyltransferase
MSIELVETHTILPDIISPGATVVDCGANLGLFSLAMIRRFGCVCYAIEAAPETFKKIPDNPSLSRYNFALAASDGLVTMSVDEDITRSTIKSGSTGARIENVVAVQGRRLSDFLAQGISGRCPDLVKMDIEGAEIEVAIVSQLTVAAALNDDCAINGADDAPLARRSSSPPSMLWLIAEMLRSVQACPGLAKMGGVQEGLSNVFTRIGLTA